MLKILKLLDSWTAAIIFCILTALLVWAIGTKTTSSYFPDLSAPPLNPANTFKVGQVEDLSGFQFAADDQKIAFSLKEAMSFALGTVLTQQGLGGPGYSINVNILAYDPGRTSRFFPAFQGDDLSVEALIVDDKGAKLAKIQVKRHVSVSLSFFTNGKLFSRDNFKEIFDDVATEIAAVIKKQTGR